MSKACKFMRRSEIQYVCSAEIFGKHACVYKYTLNIQKRMGVILSEPRVGFFSAAGRDVVELRVRGIARWGFLFWMASIEPHAVAECTQHRRDAPNAKPLNMALDFSFLANNFCQFCFVAVVVIWLAPNHRKFATFIIFVLTARGKFSFSITIFCNCCHRFIYWQEWCRTTTCNYVRYFLFLPPNMRLLLLDNHVQWSTRVILEYFQILSI